MKFEIDGLSASGAMNVRIYPIDGHKEVVVTACKKMNVRSTPKPAKVSWPSCGEQPPEIAQAIASAILIAAVDVCSVLDTMMEPGNTPRFSSTELKKEIRSTLIGQECVEIT